MRSHCERCGVFTGDGIIICRECALELHALGMGTKHNLRIPRLVTNEKPRRDYR